MKTVKKVLIGILIAIILILVLAYFLPRELKVEVKDNVDAPPNYAYNLLNDYKNQKKWDPWVAMDTTMAYVYGENTLGKDAYLDYSSDEYGAGRSTRVESIMDEKIGVEVTSENSGGASMNYTFTPTNGGQGTALVWDFSTEISWPMNLLNFLSKSHIKSAMKDGVKKISTISNKRWKEGSYDGYVITEEVIEARTYVTHRDVIAIEKSDKFYSQNLQPLFMKIQKAGVVMGGKSGVLIYNHDMEKNLLDLAAAIPINEEVAIEGAGSETLEAGRALVANYYGDRSGTGAAHTALDEYMRDRGLFLNYPVVEEYVTDPSDEPDPEKWLTRVIYYLAE